MTETVRRDQYQNLIICYLQETQFQGKVTYRLKERMKKDIPH